MKLTLRIENFDYLPDGGPLEFSASDRGFEVGRDTAMDWTLPDPNRHISSRHFEITCRDRQFWLHDISTNGTFVYGQSMRVSSPHPLADNDRLQVGHYIIRVLIADEARPAVAGWPAPAAALAPSPVSAAPVTPAADPWSLVPNPAPMPAPMPLPNRPATPLAGQYGDSFIEAPRPAAPPPPPPLHLSPAQAADPAAPPVMGGAAGSVPRSEPFSQPPVAEPAAPAAPAAPVADVQAFLDAICRGAGLPAGSLARTDAARLGEDIGRSLRIATEELMALLGARAAAKQFVKSSSRTMIGGMNNSPLKFKPNAAEALMTMFVQRPESYLSATAAFQQGFDDIKRHQTAVYAAMQPALAKLLEDLAPESIQERASGGIMSSRKANAWEIYVERWDAKTHPYENGMLDVFLAYFADAYDDAVKKTGG
ncbi:MAG: type VI secretion system-associated FHA domain protein TagH [Paracoccaceae bacterium]